MRFQSQRLPILSARQLKTSSAYKQTSNGINNEIGLNLSLGSLQDWFNHVVQLLIPKMAANITSAN